MALAMVLVPGCTVLGDKEQTIKNYRLDKPERFNMPESLLEISGIALYKGKKDTFYAIPGESAAATISAHVASRLSSKVKNFAYKCPTVSDTSVGSIYEIFRASSGAEGSARVTIWKQPWFDIGKRNGRALS